MKNFVAMLKNESGASAAEYALILAIIGSVLALAAVALGSAIGNAINDTTTCIDSDGTNCP